MPGCELAAEAGKGGNRPGADGRKIMQPRRIDRIEIGMVKINTTGTVINSEHPSHQVRVEYDAEKTGGYFIFEWWDGSGGPHSNRAFDSWVETLSGVSQFIAESGWKIRWQ